MDYDDILNRSWDDVPEPKLLPNGAWLLRGTNAALVRPKEDGQALKVLLTYKVKQPVNVPDDLLEELGDYDLSINDLTATFYIENASDWDKVRKHLALSGVEMKGSILNEAGKLAFAKAFRDSEIVAQVGERSYQKDGVTIWQNSLGGFQRVSD